ncbi:MAG TPA: 5-oxoprolinase subunit PxpB [Nitrospira sp.]|nr:5-oxoprolinase subunit PxpB [Nitrospira sp.]
MSPPPHVRRRTRTSPETFRLLSLGDSAVTIEFGNAINPESNARVIAFAQMVSEQGWNGILDIVPSYRSVTLHFDPLQWDAAALTKKLKTLPWEHSPQADPQGLVHEIPVLYGGEWGPDLEEVATFAGLQVAEVIALHTAMPYRVYMLGFSPGFPYLGLVPEQLAIPRRATPRTMVPAGSVGIADRQTGIYPTATPGGWQLIGRTPIPLYRTASHTPFLLKPGDLVRFTPIERDEFDRLSHLNRHENA